MASKRIVKDTFKNLPYGLVDLAIEERWIKSLAYFCHFTTTFSNGIIYKYSSRSLASKLNISKSTVHKHVSFLLKKGLMEIDHKGHLKGLSSVKLREWVSSYTGSDTGTGFITIKIHHTSGVRFTEWNLYARIPINTINKQRHVASKRAEVNVISQKIQKGLRISRRDYNFYTANKDSFKRKNTENAIPNSGHVSFLSDSYLSKHTKLSVGTVRSMICFWESEGILEFTFVKGRVLDQRVSKKSFSAIQDTLEGYSNTYLYRGRIIEYNKRIAEYGYMLAKGKANSI